MKAFAPTVGVVTATNVVMQNFERQGHDECAAMSMHDGLWQSCRAAGIDDPQRMVKGQPHGPERFYRCIVASNRVGKWRAVGQACIWLEIGQHNEMLHTR